MYACPVQLTWLDSSSLFCSFSKTRLIWKDMGATTRRFTTIKSTVDGGYTYKTYNCVSFFKKIIVLASSN